LQTAIKPLSFISPATLRAGYRKVPRLQRRIKNTLITCLLKHHLGDSVFGRV
jgi:hypothetical protein